MADKVEQVPSSRAELKNQRNKVTGLSCEKVTEIAGRRSIWTLYLLKSKPKKVYECSDESHNYTFNLIKKVKAVPKAAVDAVKNVTGARKETKETK